MKGIDTPQDLCFQSDYKRRNGVSLMKGIDTYSAIDTNHDFSS